MIKFWCASCGAKMGLEDRHAGRRVKCPKCGQEMTAPAAEPATSPTGGENTGGLSALEEALNAEKTAAARPVQFTPPPAVVKAPATTFQLRPPEKAAAVRKGIPRWAIICGILGFVICLAVDIGPAIFHQITNRQEAAELEVEAAKARQMVRDHPGDSRVAQEQLEALASKAQDSSTRMTGDAKEQTEAGVEMLRWMQTITKPYQEALARLQNAGSLSPPTLTSPQVIAERLAMVNALADANEALDVQLQGLSAHFSQILDQHGMSAAARTNMLKELDAKYPVATLRQIRETDRQITAAMREILQLLAARWGKWSVKPDGKLIIEGHEQFLAYNASFQKLTQASAEQQRLQAGMMTGQ